jgi:predicted tellurium resistance membrane protein TerC
VDFPIAGLALTQSGLKSVPMDAIAPLLTDPAAWAALLTLIAMEVVLGVDNLIFISILSNKLPEAQRQRARRIGISLALVMRLALLSTLAWLVHLTEPVLALPWTIGAIDLTFSWRDLILIAGGLFLLWKATKEIHGTMDPKPSDDVLDKRGAVASNFGAAIVQIIVLDLVFSVDSILTAVGMTDQLPIMVAAVVITVGIMLVAADPLANFIHNNPSLVMLALGFLLMIGMVLVADGFGSHIPKGYIYTAMAFSVGVEILNMVARKGGNGKTPGH